MALRGTRVRVNAPSERERERDYARLIIIDYCIAGAFPAAWQ